MRAGREMFVGILGVSAALVYLSLLSGIGLAADAPVSFAGKNIRIIVPVAPGGGLDLQSRALAPLLQKHIPGNPTVAVQNVAGAGE